MLLVTGANGKIGSRIIPILIQKGFKIRVLGRDPKLERYREFGADIMFGDATWPRVMAEAMQGCDQVFYIPPRFSYQETKMAQIAIDAAADAGVRQFVLMSVIHPHMDTMLHHTMKLNAEKHLIYKGLSHKLNYTIIQPVHFHHNLVVDRIIEEGGFYHYNSPDIPMAYVNCEDIGEVVSKILSENCHNCATYQLCGPDYVVPSEVAEIFKKVSGRDVVPKQVKDEDLEELWPRFVPDDPYAKEALFHMQYTYSRFGFAGNKNVMEWLLGRASTDLETYFQRELQRLGYPVEG
ncbi:NmrA family NAD(P)-binding protein [Selenomonadales bacterium OttesenSCG-928-I06]|nr:NmrA family NAD(P)-binding protein [Selenomonadales bacterium OttesenSCG-928-I06]